MPGARLALTSELEQQILNFIGAGGFPHVAAEAAGVPKSLFDRWLERGTSRGAREPYRSFARHVRQTAARARLKAEIEAREKDPRFWLIHGPARETADSPGWASQVKPASAAEASEAARSCAGRSPPDLAEGSDEAGSLSRRAGRRHRGAARTGAVSAWGRFSTCLAQAGYKPAPQGSSIWAAGAFIRERPDGRAMGPSDGELMEALAKGRSGSVRRAGSPLAPDRRALVQRGSPGRGNSSRTCARKFSCASTRRARDTGKTARLPAGSTESP